MTQLLLFDALDSSAGLATPVYPSVVAEPTGGKSNTARKSPAVTASTPLPQLSRSLPLYDPQRGELHHFGDLAQGVISRYEIVAQRRAVLLARGPRQVARA
ncbi:hypothetical protein [Roseimaritima ulvae]|uniref:Uncharacterized protein n=1 Tax=Roseimaritima ulvae TaxID=980254 RepID=A0A5B9QT57_9BACT|nr:hypothetical protein [Roseimaritima ulvae]QEG41092.1 hypothetical protein UC8_31100 [Roseimaritima ulvae]